MTTEYKNTIQILDVLPGLNQDFVKILTMMIPTAVVTALKLVVCVTLVI